MKTNCLMCGREISQGIVCEKCDRPKRSSKSSGGSAAAALNFEPETSPAPVAAATPEVDPFPKAPIVPFPRESTSVALTNMYEVLATSGGASILLDAEHHVKFVSPLAQQALQLPSTDGVTAKQLEMALGFTIHESGQIFNLNVFLNGAKTSVAVIPLSGGSGGYVLLLKIDEKERESAFMTFVREAVMTPLGALQAALAAAVLRKKDPLLQDAVNTIDQILSSLELAPTEQTHPQPTRPTRAPKAAAKAAEPRVTEVLEKLVETHGDLASIKGVKLQLDVPATDETFKNADQLAEAMAILVDNAVEYVPDGGQVVLGLRFLEHKGQPLLLFFVMDNGPVVPEEMRERIFEPDFTPDPTDDARSGKSLARVRDFALAHGGQIWVESKTGKACTFFVRVRPDSER